MTNPIDLTTVAEQQAEIREAISVRRESKLAMFMVIHLKKMGYRVASNVMFTDDLAAHYFYAVDDMAEQKFRIEVKAI